MYSNWSSITGSVHVLFNFAVTVWFRGITCSIDRREAVIGLQTMTLGEKFDFWIGSSFYLFVAQTWSFWQFPGEIHWTFIFCKYDLPPVFICPVLSLLANWSSLVDWFLQIYYLQVLQASCVKWLQDYPQISMNVSLQYRWSQLFSLLVNFLVLHPYFNRFLRYTLLPAVFRFTENDLHCLFCLDLGWPGL